MAVINSNNAQLTFSNLPVGIQVTRVTDTSADWPSVANSTYFYDKGDGLVHYKNSSGVVLELFSAGGLSYWLEAESTSAPNATVNVDSLTPNAATTNADAAIVPKGTGALLAAIPDNTAAGGNKRGTNSIDLQTTRTNADQVASGNCSVVIGSNSKASSNQGVAIGIGALASGTGVALNSNSNITGANAIASGVGSFAVNGGLSQGNWSFAIGRSVASGLNSFAGAGYYGPNTASGGYGSLAIGEANTASGPSSVSLGSSNIASGSKAVALGQSNTASAAYSLVNGGRSNTSSSLYAAISGGFKNLSQGIAGFIGGGNCNSICNSTSGCLAFGAVVAGGVGNNTTGGTWTLASGCFTVAPTICNAGQYSFIGGGFQNTTPAIYSTVVGGKCNTSSGIYSTSFGFCNIASGTYSTAGGGVKNCATAIGSGTFSGRYNTSSNYESVVSGGISNIASGQRSVVSGGRLNTASGSYSTVIGGRSNIASGSGAVAGGCSNTASGTASTASGYLNTSAGFTAIAMGYGNITSYDYQVAIGTSNSMSGTTSLAMAFGSSNTVNASCATAWGRSGLINGITARQVYSPGRFTSNGDSQKSNFFLRVRTTTNTTVDMTTDAATSINSTNSINLSNNAIYRYTGSIIAKEAGTTNIASWDIDGLIVRGASAATTSLVISNVNLVSNAPGWTTPVVSAFIDAFNGVGALRVQVTGATTTNIQWNSVINTTEGIYA